MGTSTIILCTKKSKYFNAIFTIVAPPCQMIKQAKVGLSDFSPKKNYIRKMVLHRKGEIIYTSELVKFSSQKRFNTEMYFKHKRNTKLK